jgi:hypothetical protein
MILTAQQILQTHRLRTEIINVGGEREINVRALPSHVIAASEKAKNPDAFVFVNAVVDETGKRLFKDEDVDEVAAEVESDLLQLVSSKAFSLSVVSAERREQIKKNLDTLRGAASADESPAT